MTNTVRAPVEKKVKVATVATYLGGVVLLQVLQATGDNPEMLGFLPGWLGGLLLPLLPALVTALTAFNAQHTPRPDLDPAPAPAPVDSRTEGVERSYGSDVPPQRTRPWGS